MLFRNEEIGAARTSQFNGVSDRNGPSRQDGPAPRLVQPPDHNALLSEGMAAFLARQRQEGAAELTLMGYRDAYFSLIDFLGDPPLRELNSETCVRWLDALRATPSYRRDRGAYPAEITRQSVSDFLRHPAPKRESGKMRSAATIAKYRTHGSHILRWLGVPVEIERRKRKVFNRLPPIVPEVDELVERWRAYLNSKVSSAHARQIVLTQALILLWDCRLEEALTALREDQEGHWVLVSGKTGMRISYLNSQSLGIVQALRGQAAWDFAAKRHTRVSGWGWGLNRWHAFVRECGVADGAKPQQELRMRATTCITAIAARDPRDAKVEQLVGGHGGTVIDKHYLDTLRRVPAVMEQFSLPAVPGFDWPRPVYVHRPQDAAAWAAEDEARAAAALVPPRRLYARFDAWLEEQERRAAS
jgi:hypothetical protein